MPAENENPQELPEHALTGIPPRPLETGITAAAPEANIAEELAHIPEEPLLPVEKVLIGGSLLLGGALLGLLVWASYTFYPAQ